VGQIVFPDPAKRKWLESVTHPAIRARFERIMADLERQGFDGILIWDAALLVESGGHKNMDKVVVVTTDPDTQLRRLTARDGSSEAAARARTASQMPLAVKARAGDYVIDNSGTREQTEARVREVYRALLEDLRQLQARR
jgi:dephospho-CoA kinase